MAPRITPTAVGDAGAEAVRAQMPYAAALQAHNAVGRLNVATYINRLIKI